MERILDEALPSSLVSVKVITSWSVTNSLASCHLTLSPLTFQVASQASLVFFLFKFDFSEIVVWRVDFLWVVELGGAFEGTVDLGWDGSIDEAGEVVCNVEAFLCPSRSDDERWSWVVVPGVVLDTCWTGLEMCSEPLTQRGCWSVVDADKPTEVIRVGIWDAEWEMAAGVLMWFDWDAVAVSVVVPSS